MSSSHKLVWAAGGVLWRHRAGKATGDVEVAIVHRPRYDDWSLPKGKAESGELLVTTAARELVEETGYEIRMGRRLTTVEYRLGSGALKKVGYWSVAATGGEFVANHECDHLRWLSVSEAIGAVSYAADRKVLRTFAAVAPDDLHTVVLVRHGRAEKRARFRGPDHDRPLDSEGRCQAAALTDLLGLFGARALHAADRVRCVQTLDPLAEALRTSIHVEPTLTDEAFVADPDKAFTRLRAVASKSGPARAVCGQGKVLSSLVSRWAARDGVEVPDTRVHKGGAWVLTLRGDTLVAVDAIPSPTAD